MMDEYLGKKYKLKSSENFEEFLKFLGIGLVARKTANSVSPVTELLSHEDGTYTLVISTIIKTTRTTFKPGEPFEEERADGVKVTTVVTFEGNVMVLVQTDGEGRTGKFVREFGPKQLKVTNTVDGWNGTCVRVYEVQE